MPCDSRGSPSRAPRRTRRSRRIRCTHERSRLRRWRQETSSVTFLYLHPTRSRLEFCHSNPQRSTQTISWTCLASFRCGGSTCRSSPSAERGSALRETDSDPVALPPRFRRPRLLIPAAAIAVLIAAGVGIYLVRRPAAPPQMAFSEFLQRVESGSVTQANFGDGQIAIVFRDGTQATTIAPVEFLTSNSSFFTDLVKRQIRVEVQPLPDPTSLSWSAMAIAAAFFGLLAFTVYRSTSGKIPSI